MKKIRVFVSGEGEKESIGPEDLRIMPKYFLTDINKGKLSKPKGQLGNYLGVSLRDIIRRIGLPEKLIRRQKLFFVVRGYDGFYVVFSYSEVFGREDGREIILAYRERKKGKKLYSCITDETGCEICCVVAPNDKYVAERFVRDVAEIYICYGADIFDKFKG